MMGWAGLEALRENQVPVPLSQREENAEGEATS